MADKEIDPAAAGMLGLTISANLVVRLTDAGVISEADALAILSRALGCISEHDRPAAQAALLTIMPDLVVAEITTFS